MATPTYKGANQPSVSSGWLSGIGSVFGGSAPAYAAAKPAVVTPAVATPTTTPAPAVVGACEPDRITVVIPRELIESGALFGDTQGASDSSASQSCTPDRITLVIPRSLIESQQ